MNMTSTFLKNIWDGFRPHLPAVLSMLLVVSLCYVGYLQVMRDTAGLAAKLQEMQRIHDDELKTIKDAQDVERKQHAENVARLESTLADVKSEYDRRLSDLEKTKGEKVEGMVRTWRTDPSGVEMAKQLGKILKVEVVLPGGTR